MTNTGASPVVRETMATYYARGRQRAIVARLDGAVIKLRLKGTRQWHTVDVRSVYLVAVRITVETAKRAKRLARKQRET